MVLGAFPIPIHALEKYREASKRFHAWAHIREHYAKCKVDVQFHQLEFEHNLRLLVLPLLLDDGKVGELLASPGGECWKDAGPFVAERTVVRVHEHSRLEGVFHGPFRGVF